MDRDRLNLFWAGFILGLGLLGAIDGIVFHRLLGWHHVIDSPNHRLELVSDGVFDLVVTALLVSASLKLFKAAANRALSFDGRLFLGSILIGGGAFNLVEGLVNHQILQVHHVRPVSANPLMYDLLFLLSGVVLIAIGHGTSPLRWGIRAKSR